MPIARSSPSVQRGNRKPPKKMIFAADFVELRELKPNPNNPRINDEAIERVAKSIKAFGWQQPIVAKANGEIVAGHTRYAAALSLNMDRAPVVRFKGTNAQANAYMVADNKTAEFAKWDEDRLIEILRDMQDDLREATGFSDREIKAMANEQKKRLDVLGIKDGSSASEEEAIPEPPAKAITKPGDLWLLGNHRVFCGDSTDRESWKALKIHRKSAVAFTSPPYNMAGKSSKLRRAALNGSEGERKQGNLYVGHDDGQDQSSWLQLVNKMLINSLEFCSASVFNVQMLSGNKAAFIEWLAIHRERLVDIAIWDKGNAQPAMGSSIMNSQFEFIAIFGEEGHKRVVPLSSWRGTVPNVYRGNAQSGNEFSKIHGATMPLHLAGWAMLTLCDLANEFVDCCGGTGTTIIAADKIDRVGKCIEVDPRYVDVILERWENHTGRKAKRG